MLVRLLEQFDAGQFDELAVSLQRTLHAHFRRIGHFHKALVTRSHFDECREENGAHRTCTFGRWYYSQATPQIRENEEFVELGRVHAGVHDSMRTLLHMAGTGGAISAEEYERFLAAYNLFTDRLTDLINQISFAQYQFDPLTKLLNRRAFERILEHELSLLQRSIGPCTIAMADIDHFKTVNDRYGHASGDAVLKSVAGLFLEQLRGYDTVGRFGGEEFIFCLPNTPLEPARKIMERLRKKVERTGVALVAGDAVRVTISVGMAEVKRAGAIDEALRDVDRALYQAKESGRNRVRALRTP